ncbi:Transcriptional regulator, RpiR family [Gulosibacter sp. 10]|nr:Transcriptional regulator, RpiR family [Gulosibacter sp. 10]
MHFDSLTGAEKRAARALTTDYPVTGMDTVQRFAERASVSPATIVRFVKSLGFDSFREFQESLRTELKERQESVLTQATSTNPHEANTGATGALEESKRVFLEGIEKTLGSVPSGEYIRTVEWLADTKRRIVTAGGTFSGLLAEHLAAQLSLFRGNVLVSPQSALHRASLVLDSRAKNDVWVLFDFRRYQSSTELLAQEVDQRGARLVLVTDRWLSPIASIADVVLIASVDAPGPSDSLVPGLALVEAIAEQVSERIGEQGIAKLEQLDPMRVRLEFGSGAG